MLLNCNKLFLHLFYIRNQYFTNYISSTTVCNLKWFLHVNRQHCNESWIRTYLKENLELLGNRYFMSSLQ